MFRNICLQLIYVYNFKVWSSLSFFKDGLLIGKYYLLGKTYFLIFGKYYGLHTCLDLFL